MDRSFRESYQKALLEQNELIAKNNKLISENNEIISSHKEEMAEWRVIIGKDDNSGLRKFVCQHEKDIRGEGNKPGIWTVVNRLSWMVGVIISIGLSALVTIAVVFFSSHPDVLSELFKKLAIGG